MANEKKLNLEDIFRGRLNDTRAMVGSLSINSNRIFLTFPAIDTMPRVVLEVIQDQVKLFTSQIKTKHESGHKQTSHETNYA